MDRSTLSSIFALGLGLGAASCGSASKDAREPNDGAAPPSDPTASSSGQLLAATVDSLVKVVGPIETPAAAVIFARLGGHPLAQCEVVAGDRLRCKRSATGTALMDPASTHGFHLAMLVPQTRCPEDDEPGPPIELGFVRVGPDGKLVPVRAALLERGRAKGVEGLGRPCKPQRMRGRRFEGYVEIPTVVARELSDEVRSRYGTNSQTGLPLDRPAILEGYEPWAVFES